MVHSEHVVPEKTEKKPSLMERISSTELSQAEIEANTAKNRVTLSHVPLIWWSKR
jgi:hypothetical protein